MTQVTLDAIRHCLDGQIPGVIATCSRDGVPNSTYVSQVHYVDPLHVALSFQFFNKTRENILANPVVAIMVADPDTAARYRMQAHYLRTETAGAVFENMKAKLAGIASQTGMSAVFKLRGADIYRIAQVAPGADQSELPSPPRRSLLAAVRNVAQSIQACNELDELLNRCLAEIESQLLVRHSMIHWLDESGERLYLVASRGYAQSGVGSEIQIGQGVIGVAASARTSIRITHTTAEYTYSRATRESVRETQLADRLEAELPAPGLSAPGSQLAAPSLRAVKCWACSTSRMSRTRNSDTTRKMRSSRSLSTWDWRHSCSGSKSSRMRVREKSPRAHQHPPAARSHSGTTTRTILCSSMTTI